MTKHSKTPPEIRGKFHPATGNISVNSTPHQPRLYCLASQYFNKKLFLQVGKIVLRGSCVERRLGNTGLEREPETLKVFGRKSGRMG